MARRLASQLHDDPRNRTETEWLEVLDLLVRRLAEATGARVQVGRYWIADDSSASLCVRVRARGPLPGVASDGWEAAICLDGDERGAWTDAYVFPFLRGSAVTRQGRLADRGPGAETDEHWQFALVEGAFRSLGWTYPEGPGEWSHVRAPGDVFHTVVECRPAAPVFSRGAPLAVEIALAAPRSPAREDQRRGDVRVSLVHANRGRSGTNLVSHPAPARPGSAHVVRFDRAGPSVGSLNVDLRTLPIRGGWRAGEYRLSLRVQNEDRAWQFSSEISAPLRIAIGSAG